jgi:hypothetical protein
MRNSEKEYFTSRKMRDYSLSSKNVTTFWTPLKDAQDGNLFGAIGLQVAFERNWNCMPDLLTKEYAAPSYMLVLDQNLTIYQNWSNELEVAAGGYNSLVKNTGKLLTAALN